MIPRFHALTGKSRCGPGLIAFAEQAQYRPVIGGINAAIVPTELLADDPQILAMAEYFDAVSAGRLSIFRFEPHTCYHWHTDSIRACAINMLLDGFDSQTYFGDMHDLHYFGNIAPADYQPDTYYFFNASVPHTIFNFSKTRYLLSIGIKREFSLTDTWQYLTQSGLV